MGKVRFGLKKVYYAPITTSQGTESYGSPVAMPGSVKITFDHDTEDGNKFWADDVAYYVDGGSSSYTGEIEIADFSDTDVKALLGYIEDSNNLIIETDDASSSRCALLFEVGGNEKPQRHVFYDVTFSRPDGEANSKTDSTTPDTVKLKFTAVSKEFTWTQSSTSVTKAVSKAHVTYNDTAGAQNKAWNAWYTTVVVPGATIA